jgi:hypothetical protein
MARGNGGETCGENHARLAVPHGWSAPVGWDRKTSGGKVAKGGNPLQKSGMSKFIKYINDL